MTRSANRVYEFGPFRLDTGNHLLLRDDEAIQLKPKVVDTLLALIESRGRVIGKDELIERLWPDTIVEESNLSQNIYLLRKTLGEGPSQQNYIETVPKRGYRFVAEVREVSEAPAAEVAQVVEPGAEASQATEKPNGIDAASAKEEAVGRRNANLPSLLKARWSAHPRLVVASFALLGLAAAAIYLGVSSWSKPPKAGAPVRSIAVLPFKPIGAAQRDEILELGMADTLITRLSNLRQIVVRPTSAVRMYTGLEQDPVAAGRELKVDAVLEGSVQKSAERIRVTARLVNVRDGSALWTGQFDEQSADIFKVQDRVSEQAARTLAMGLTDEEKQRLARRYTDNIEAYQLYLSGRYFLYKVTPEGNRKGIEYFQQAIDKDPAYALAYTGLADCYIQLGNWQMLPPNESFPKAMAAAEKALKLDDALAEAHISLASVKSSSWDWASAEADFKRAIDLN